MAYEEFLNYGGADTGLKEYMMNQPGLEAFLTPLFLVSYFP